IDILVCTTIVETGVDLPNANTLIIENADRMGLSQLHQIRGRVGRSSRHAYAYFTFRPGKALSEIAVKRLSAIREYAEFGAGFKIALRDLEIRGAGNLLGAEQHGHIDQVGYDLYIRLLNEAILEEQGKVAPAISEAKIEYPDSAHIPSSYIPLSAHRMEMYKKISLIQTEDDQNDVLSEFRERFGEPPRETRRLLWLSLLRAAASRVGLTRVEFRGREVKFVTRGVGDLSVWAVVFSERQGLRFGGGRGDAGVFLKLAGGEDGSEAATRVLLLYEEKKKELHPDGEETGGK
ncbi:MAG: transcription-repair coupling factor, partial [Clostridia bacterium]|nr:transcription-repair coupling factor [Clostridia bacterium]